MSININWEDATSGPDGEALAERIRSFIHDKFQQIALPRFIRSVEVTSFDLGSVPPELDIRDLSDPFADFYEADEDDDELSDGGDEEAAPAATGGREGAQGVREGRSARDGEKWPAGPSGTLTQEINGGFHPLSMQHAFNHQHTVAPTRLGSPIGDPLNTYRFFPRPGTSGILGGTSNNMRYYHMPLGGLSGTSTPLAAVAGGGGGGGGAKGGTSPTSPDASPTPEQQEREQHAYCLSEAEDEVFQQRRAQGRNPSGQDVDAVSGRNLSAQQPPQAAQGTTQSPPPMYFPNTSTSPSPHRRMRERKAEDFQ
ncbi:Mitochondrial distribution and morphology protein 12, partial [Ascosphaera atra]